MRNPLVTVFMPVYNSEQYIEEALQSIVQQTYTNLDILIVDDGSTDRSVELIRQFQDPRIRLIQNERNRGIPYTRNVGLREARGKYIAIMDSDDVAAPTRIERQVAFLEENETIDAVASDYIQFGGKVSKKVKAPFHQPEALKVMLLFYNPIANPSVMMRKQTLVENGLTYHEDFFVAQDYQLWSQLIKVGNICIMPEYLLHYRFGHENISKKSNQEKQLKRKALIASIHRDLLNYYDVGLTEEELESFNEFFTESYGGQVQNWDSLEQVITKLKSWNQETKTFDHEIFLNVLDHCIKFAIEHQNIHPQKKVQLYQRLSTAQSIKCQLSIVAKHLYHRLRKVY